ncbi:hypothetical protein D3C80_1330930 [compost metagenome]
MLSSLQDSASNTSMKVRPMILRFFSGSASPARLPRNCSSALARITLTPMFSANMAITCSPSCRRSRPLSTNTQVSWSPMALCSSAATTDESTPPDRPSRTLSVPTWARTWAMASSAIFDGVHRASHSQMSRMKRDRMRPPCLVWVTSGWNCTP